MEDLSTAIIASTGIIAGTATLWRLFFWGKKNNPNPNNSVLRKDMNEKFGKVVSKDTCGAYREGEKRQFKDLQIAMTDGFKGIQNQLTEMRKDIRNSR